MCLVKSLMVKIKHHGPWLLFLGLAIFYLPGDCFSQGTNLGALVSINTNTGATNGTLFRVWAPNATSVAVAGTWSGWTPIALKRNLSTLYWESTNGSGNPAVLTTALPGHEYRYIINNRSTWNNDPRAVLISTNTNSVIYSHRAFNWGNVTSPVIPPERQVMYEMHIGTFHDPNPRDTAPGTFDDAIERLPYLQRLGVNVIALRPVNEFNGDRSWGYNPYQAFAIESSYGGPDGLKRFVKRAHELGMLVQLDVVHNHYLGLGPGDKPSDSIWNFDGTNNCYFYADTDRQWTPWGPRPNYDQAEVRRYIQESIKTLLDDFRIDGFRWDSPQNILGYDTTRSGANPNTVLTNGKTMMMAINRMIHTNYPNHWSIAEDADLLTVRPDGSWYATNSFHDLLRVDDVADSFDGHWQTSFHNEITPQVASNSPSIWTISNKVSGWSEPPGYRVIFTDNHDKAGGVLNAGATRLASRMVPADPAGNIARKKTLLNAALTVTAPGVPMFFMGQEFQSTGFWHDTTPLDWKTAISQEHQTFRAHRDLIELRETLPALQNSNLDSANGFVNDEADLMAFWRLGAANQDHLVILFNFSAQNLNVTCPFPTTGTWYVQFNSDWAIYGDDFSNLGPAGNTVVAALQGSSVQATVTVAAYSGMVFARISAPAERTAVDFDADGIPDGWEAMVGANTNTNDAHSDLDGDGIPNLQEYSLGRDAGSADTMYVVGMPGSIPLYNPGTNDPVDLRMAWSSVRQRWEWLGTWSGVNFLEFRFRTGPGTNGLNYGASNPQAFTDTNGLAQTSGTNNLRTTASNARYRFSFLETSGVYTVENFPISTEWREANGLPASGAWTNDTDKDGIADLLEYALGGSPTNSADGMALQSFSNTNSGGTNRLVLQWLQRTNGGSSLSVSPEMTTDLLGSWSGLTASNAISQSNVPVNHVRREVSTPQDGSRKFLRLKVTGP